MSKTKFWVSTLGIWISGVFVIAFLIQLVKHWLGVPPDGSVSALVSFVVGYGWGMLVFTKASDIYYDRARKVP